jgi:hypothetical protein
MPADRETVGITVTATSLSQTALLAISPQAKAHARPAKKEAADRQRPKFREEMPKESTRRVEPRAVAKLCSIRWSRD